MEETVKKISNIIYELIRSEDEKDTALDDYNKRYSIELKRKLNDVIVPSILDVIKETHDCRENYQFITTIYNEDDGYEESIPETLYQCEICKKIIVK